MARRRHLAVLDAADRHSHADRSRDAALAGAGRHPERSRYRRDLHHRRARAVRGPGSVDRCAAVAALLPCAADVVQDLQCGDSRREPCYVTAGRRDDLAHRVARGELHALAAPRQTAQGRGARFRCRQPSECTRAGRAVTQHPPAGIGAHQALRFPPLFAHPSRGSAALIVGTQDASKDDLTLTISASTSRPIQIKFDRVPAAAKLHEAIDAHVAETQWFGDVHGSAPYKRHLTYYYAEQIRAELAR